MQIYRNELTILREREQERGRERGMETEREREREREKLLTTFGLLVGNCILTKF
jgi:hypothetical protein